MENKQEQKAKELAAKRAKYPVLDGGVTDECASRGSRPTAGSSQ